MNIDLRGEFLIDGTWVDATGNILTRQSLTHTRGRPDMGARVDPSTCRPLIDNTDGRFSPDNPMGPYYGRFGRNTPFRLSVAGPTTHLVTGGPADRAQTDDHASLDIVGDIDVRVEASLTNWRARDTPVELAGKYEATAGNKSWLFFAYQGRLYFYWSVDGSADLTSSSNAPLVIPPSGRMAVRATLDVDNGASGRMITFYTAESMSGPWVQLGTPVVQAGVTSVFNSARPVQVGAVGTLTFADPLGRFHRFELRNGINGPAVANPDFTTQTPGAVGFTDSAGRPWTLGGNAVLTNRATRLSHELAAYPTQWHPSGAHAWVDAQTAGILRRLRRGSHALASTLRRRIPSAAPLAYWPMEEGREASQFYSPIARVRPLATSGMDIAADDSLPGSSALPAVRAGATLSGAVPGSATGAWHTEFVFKLPNNGPATARTVLQWTSTGTVKLWRLLLTTNGSQVYGYDDEGTVVASSLLNLTGLGVFNAWCRWQLFATQSGGNVSWSVRFVPIGGQGTGLVTSSYAGTLGRINGVRGADGGYSADLEGLVLGHIAVLSTANSTIYNAADLGFTGETAGTRMERLAVEESIPLTVCGNVSEQTAVGSQRPMGVLDLLEEAADADGGILYEDRDQPTLRYRGRGTLYNQKPALVLDYDGPGLAPPLTPTGDDEATQNDITINRIGGSSARAVLEEGRLSIQAPPNGVGLGYDTSEDLSLYLDEQAEPIAWWRLHLGTYEGRRYPQVRVLVHQAPGLLEQILAVDVGDKIVIRNPPIWVAPGDIELIVQGYEETFSSDFEWDIVFNCTPAEPWTVAELAVVEDFEDTTYEVAWTNGGTLPWARSTAQAHTGTWSLKSGAITNNQTSDATFAVPAGKTELRFWYWTSSEASGAGFEGDRLLVLVDGVQVLRAQGTTPWTQAIIDVTGKSSVTFRYVKDNSTAVGSDSVHIDNLSFTGRGPTRADTDGSALTAGISETAASFAVTTTSGPVWTQNPAQFPFSIRVGGEVMTVTGITGAASPQTFTVVRSVNGIVKGHAAGTDVRLAHPAHLAL